MNFLRTAVCNPTYYQGITGGPRNSRIRSGKIPRILKPRIMREHCTDQKWVFLARFTVKIRKKSQIREGKSANSEFWYIFIDRE
jgi:hypothetical protein